MESQLCCIWQAGENGARLVRVLGETPCPALPESLAGHSLTELGAYCFAPALRTVPGPVFATQGSQTQEYPSLSAALAACPLPELCGAFLQSAALPASVQLIDNAAFYNCRSLQTLHFGPALRRVGSDCFTNCFALKTLVLHAVPSAPSGLNKVLACISAPVTVNFYREQLLAQLFFPEYADDNLENGPAHIFMHEFQGVGYLFRQCFGLGGELRFSEYDACFARAKALETPEVLCRIALGRLRFPAGLADTSAEEYRACCRSQASALAALLLHERDLPALQFACRENLFSAEALAEAAALAAKQNQPQAAALLMQAQKPGLPAPKHYDFDF